MKLFGGGAPQNDPVNPVDPVRLAEQQRRQELSVQSLMAGGLPIDATERLKEQASKQGTPQHFFTSDLSVNEFLVAKEIGYEPLGLVMGSSVYHIGWQNMPGSWWYSSGELETLTASHSEARRLAMNRMLQEAALLGADGVTGVRLTQKTIEMNLIEFMAVGTAVRHPQDRTQGGQPFLSDLSGQEIWSLEKGGFLPAGFAFGTCVYFQTVDWRGQNALWSWGNVEMTSLTQGFYIAREIAMSRLTSEFERTNADGVVGVSIENYAHHYTDSNDNLIGLIIHYTAFGTAITRMPTRVDVALNPILPLNDG